MILQAVSIVWEGATVLGILWRVLWVVIEAGGVTLPSSVLRAIHSEELLLFSLVLMEMQ